MTLAAIVLAGAAVAGAQEPAPTPTPAPAAQPATPEAPRLTFEGDTALVTLLVKPDKTTEFESVLAKVKESMMKSEKPERKNQAAGWTVYKVPQPVQGSVVYYFLIQPVVKGQEYDPVMLINEVFPSEATALFNTFKESRNGGASTTLQTVMKMGQ
ncbi:MAG: hypothetical protein LC791_03200 [Acidobacteria bacterium]|nr:hypothetical protein [Acidobacteriota bacterium]